MKYIHTIAIALGLLVLSGTVGFIGMQYIQIKQQEVKNAARFECAQSSRYQVTDTTKNVTTWYPIADLYSTCLKEKGL